MPASPTPPGCRPPIQQRRQCTPEPCRIVSPGGGHHGTLDEWHAQFPGAKVLLPPGRIPRTKHGQELMKLPRVELLDASDPFPQFRGQLEAVIFDGLLGFRDVQNVREGAKDSPFATIKFMLTEMPPRDPIDELWVHHVATGTVIGGENLGWIQTGESLKAFPFMIRMMLQADAVYVMGGARRVADKAKVAAHWKRILEWPAKTVMTYHDPPTVAFQGDGRAAIEAAAKKVKQL